MTFITYAFLGLCLPMVALCAGDIECCFKGDFVLGIVTEPTPLGPEIATRSIYVNVDEKWTLEKTEAEYISYDFRTNTRATYDLTSARPHCKKDEIPEDDVIYRYLCIDKGAVQSRGPYNGIQYQVSLGASSSITYVTKRRRDAEGVCTPIEAEYRSSDPTVADVRLRYIIWDGSYGSDIYESKKIIHNMMNHLCRY